MYVASAVPKGTVQKRIGLSTQAWLLGMWLLLSLPSLSNPWNPLQGSRRERGPGDQNLQEVTVVLITKLQEVVQSHQIPGEGGEQSIVAVVSE